MSIDNKTVICFKSFLVISFTSGLIKLCFTVSFNIGSQLEPQVTICINIIKKQTNKQKTSYVFYCCQ